MPHWKMSPLAEGRELKYEEFMPLNIDFLSPLAEGRELKLQYRLIQKPVFVAPRGGA